MIHIENESESEIPVIGQLPKSEFIITAVSDKGSSKNIFSLVKIREYLNKNLKLIDYTEVYKHLTLVYIVVSPDLKSTLTWQERKYIKRQEKTFLLNIKFPCYEIFCNSTEQKTLQIMAEQTLRGIEKFLCHEKQFNFIQFYQDVKTLFTQQCWL